MTENQSSVFPENLQEISPADIANQIKDLSSAWLEAVSQEQPTEPEKVTMPQGQSFAEFREQLNRKPEYQLIHIGSDLANAAALLHVAYKSSAFEDEDYEEEIFKKSIGSGGDQVLIQKILDLVTQCYEKVNSLRSQLESGEE